MPVFSVSPKEYGNALPEIEQAKTVTVLVYHPQCGHCIRLRPVWEQMKKRLAMKNALIYEIDGSGFQSHPEIAQSVVGKHTDGFPTIMQLSNGELTEKFNEERNVPNMLDFIKKYYEGKLNNLSYTYKLNNKGNLKRVNKNKKPTKSKNPTKSKKPPKSKNPTKSKKSNGTKKSKKQ
jgi:hypothetical protein